MTIDRGQFTLEEQFPHKLRTHQDTAIKLDIAAQTRQNLHAKLVQKKLQSNTRVSGATVKMFHFFEKKHSNIKEREGNGKEMKVNDQKLKDYQTKRKKQKNTSFRPELQHLNSKRSPVRQNITLAGMGGGSAGTWGLMLVDLGGCFGFVFFFWGGGRCEAEMGKR